MEKGKSGVGVGVRVHVNSRDHPVVGGAGVPKFGSGSPFLVTWLLKSSSPICCCPSESPCNSLQCIDVARSISFPYRSSAAP